jgi:hypothetical protein
VSGITYAWSEALVASLFTPFFVTELPKRLAFRLLGGFHASLALVIGIGTFFAFLNRRIAAIRAMAKTINDRLREQAFQEKFSIVGERLEAA